MKNQVQVTEGLLWAGGTTLPSSDSRTEVVGMMGEPPKRQGGWGNGAGWHIPQAGLSHGLSVLMFVFPREAIGNTGPPPQSRVSQ